jgi:hypothetical protein
MSHTKPQRSSPVSVGIEGQAPIRQCRFLNAGIRPYLLRRLVLPLHSRRRRIPGISPVIMVTSYGNISK